MSYERYDVAQICLNGHVINDSINKQPQNNREFCKECGEKTITECPNCRNEIEGAKYVVPYALSGPYADQLFPGNKYEKMPNYEISAYCPHCGNPFPWTERKIIAAHELVDELENFTSEEKETLKNDIDEMIKDTPKSESAAIRFKKYLPKIRKEAADFLRKLLVDIVSETIKKTVWP